MFPKCWTEQKMELIWILIKNPQRQQQQQQQRKNSGIAPKLQNCTAHSAYFFATLKINMILIRAGIVASHFYLMVRCTIWHRQSEMWIFFPRSCAKSLPLMPFVWLSVFAIEKICQRTVPHTHWRTNFCSACVKYSKLIYIYNDGLCVTQFQIFHWQYKQHTSRIAFNYERVLPIIVSSFSLCLLLLLLNGTKDK